MTPAGLLAFEESVKKPHLIYDNRSDGDPDMPDDLMKGLKKNTIDFKNFANFSQSVRRIYIEWLNSAKRPETRTRRIGKIVNLAEKNIKPGIL